MRKIAILDLPCRGNEEFQPLLGNPAFDAARVTPHEFQRRFPDGADIVIIPGSRETVKDYIYLCQTGGVEIIRRTLARGGAVIGICGGFQMLGERLEDPRRNQGPLVSSTAMGYLPISTTFGPNMLLCKTEAELVSGSGTVKGVEGRSGTSYTTSTRGFTPLLKISRRKAELPIPSPQVVRTGGHWSKEINWAPGSEPVDGLVSDDRKVWGTYLHLIFHNPAFMKQFFESLP